MFLQKNTFPPQNFIYQPKIIKTTLLFAMKLDITDRLCYIVNMRIYNILTQFITCLVIEVVLGILTLLLGLSIFGDFGNYETAGSYLIIIGVSFGGLIGTLSINKLLNDKINNIYLFGLTPVLAIFWLIAYSSYGSKLSIYLIVILTSTIFTLLNSLPFVKKLD